MRNILALCAALVGVALGVSSCGSALTLALGGNTDATTYVDDLYAVHDRAALREAERAEAERLAKQKEEYEKRLAALSATSKAGEDIDQLLDLSAEGIAAAGGVVTSDKDGNVTINYNTIYVDDYASAYARRLQGFTSLSYRMPSSYWNFRYSDAYFLSLAYDPAFYTVMVVGDSVWVEPRYITNMFGSWNNPYYYGYRYGYNPYYYGYSYGYWDYWAWNSPYWACDPFFYNPYYHPYYHNWYAPHHHHHNHPYPSHRPAGPGDHKKPNVTHKPSYGTSAGGGSSMRPSGGALSYNDRLGGRGSEEIITETKGTSSSSSVRPSTRPATGTVQNGANLDRGGSVINKPATKGELSNTLSGTTIKFNPTRGGGTSGVSNSSTRSSRSSGTTIRSTTTTTSTPKKSSSAVKSSSSSSNRSSSSSSSSSSRSSYSSSSSSSRSSSYSSGSSSSSSRSSYSSSRSSYSSGSSTRSGSGGSSSTRSGR